jgi:hypothetical protein
MGKLCHLPQRIFLYNLTIYFTREFNITFHVVLRKV